MPVATAVCSNQRAWTYRMGRNVVLENWALSVTRLHEDGYFAPMTIASRLSETWTGTWKTLSASGSVMSAASSSAKAAGFNRSTEDGPSCTGARNPREHAVSSRLRYQWRP